MFIDATDLHLLTVNISWSSLSQSIYKLTITNTYNQPQMLKLNQSYYGFTAPEGAPPCEIYNFSVTATYVGATYTGAGCSVPSPVLSRMLPSLPNIGPPAFTLQKQSTGVTLNSLFEVHILFSHLAMFCTLNHSSSGSLGTRLCLEKKRLKYCHKLFSEGGY